ncbi:MAG: DUF29 domain-containing protein [Gammaproteobacteria bacterium]|nr:DUF29 domain-containing protein [Gammaproteobacteria bacterium]
MSDPAELYETDFFRWTQEQATLLRQAPGERINLPIDWRNTADEIEDMGRRDLRSVNTLIGVIYEHLLRLEHSPAADPRRVWRHTVRRSRDEIQRILDDSPSLRSKLSQRWQKEFQIARRNALDGLEEDGIHASDVPNTPPYSQGQVLDRTWWPANRHGHTS